MRLRLRRGLEMVVILIVFMPTLCAEGRRAVTPVDLVDIRVLRDVQISPDGKRAVFVVTEPADPKKPESPRDSNIWMVPIDGSEEARLFAASAKSDTLPRWSPDGRYLAFLSNRGEPLGEDKEAKSQIYLLRTDGGEAEQLTRVKGEVENLKWSRDGAIIAFTVKDPLSEEEQKKQKQRDDAFHVDHEDKYSRLWVWNRSSRQVEQVTNQNLHVKDFDWSPDGSELALRVSPTPHVDDMGWHSSLVVIRRLTGEVVRTLSQNVVAGPEWSPDGQSIAFLEFTPNKIAEWLALVPAAGGPVRQVLKDYQGTIWDFKWTSDSKYLLAESNEGTKDKLLRVDTAGVAYKALAGALMPGPDFSASSDGRTLAYLSQGADAPQDVWVVTIGESPRRLTKFHPQMASLRLGEVKDIGWKNKKDGQALFGVLVTPPDFKPGQPFPMIVEVHGGPQWAWWSGWLGSWHEWAQLLASNGYVVFLPNPRGSTGHGWRFAEANRDDWGGMDFQDIMDGVDFLVDQKIADATRLGIGGWSYGGFMTSWAVTQTNRFKAAVVGAAVTNLFSFNGTTDITPGFLRSYFLDIPSRRRVPYDNHSAMTFLKNCKTPSLVLHGQADDRVPVSQGFEFYSGLKALGVETEMVVYPREPHALKERAHQIDLLQRILAWYDKYLKK